MEKTNTIWKQPGIGTENLNGMTVENMGQWMGIRFTEMGENFLKATMPVDHRTRQPFGLLHGGASAALAETLGSVASWLCIDPETQAAVGVEINCNHIRGKREGTVEGTVMPLSLGGTIHVWDIRIRDEGGHLICISRLTVAIRTKSGLNK